MATRAIGPARAPAADWRAALRRSVRRAGQMAGAAGLFAAMVFLGLALASYAQTDPSASTAAAGDDVRNWMGAPGAWFAERVYFLFGVSGVLLLPLLYVSARKLWREVEEEDRDERTRWWRPLGLLLFSMALIGTVLSLAFDSPGGSLPASMGGIAGLLGAGAIEAVAGRLGDSAAGWAILGLALLALAGGVAGVTKVFALDWAQLLTLPRFLKRRPALGEIEVPFLPKPRAVRRASTPEEPPQIVERRAPEIADPSTPPRAAKPAGKKAQKDLFATYQLPSLDLLSEPPAQAPPKLDKLALERNARLLETVLDDFNVKGEITAVRTGPVVTMYELEPAPGIKASRVIGLAEDIARNMSAISARRISFVPSKIRLIRESRTACSYGYSLE